MKLYKQLYLCKECLKTWSARTDIVEEGHTLSHQLKRSVLHMAREGITATGIARICHCSPSSVIRIIDEDNQGALHEPLHEPGKSCGEIRSCRPECPVHQVHQGIVSEFLDHHRPLPHRTAGRKSAGQCKDKHDEEDERLPLQGIQDTEGTLASVSQGFR